MKITTEISVRAIKHGIILTPRMSKTYVIRTIQRSEGENPCFRTDERDYCRGGCEWEPDCKNALIAAWQR